MIWAGLAVNGPLLCNKFVIFTFYLDFICPNKIHAKLSGAVQETFDWDSRIYEKGSALENGKPYWYHNASGAAIWWSEGKWRIGLLKNLGSKIQGQHSTTDSSGDCPTSHGTIWLYWDGKKTKAWLKTGDDTRLTPIVGK